MNKNLNQSTHAGALVPQNNSYGAGTPPELFSLIQYLAAENAFALNLAVKNEQLKNQLANRQYREQAYTKTYEMYGQTYTQGRYGTSQLLMDATIEAAFFYLPELPLLNERFYLIRIANSSKVVYISEKNYSNDLSLINAFQQRYIRVYIINNRKTTADLLRREINLVRCFCPLSLYGGWKAWSEENDYQYCIFPPFSTLLSENNVMPSAPISIPSKAIIAPSVQQFWPAFEIVRTSFLLDMVILLYHEAALHTLLRELGYKFPLACCFFSTENMVLEYFRNLLSWFNCPPLTLDAPNSDFAYGLLSRKDQPLLIEDSGRLSQAAKNTDTLVSAMTNDTVAWKQGRETPQSLPMQAPVTLLSSRPSALSCSPDSIVLDFFIEDFDAEAWLDRADEIGQNQDYLTAFCGYASEHIPELRSALEEGKKAARYYDGGQLSRIYLQVYGILIGLRSFLESFFAYAMPESPAFSLSNGELACHMLDLLVQTMEKADRSSLADQFVEVTRRFIETRTLSPHPTERCPVDMNSVVLYNTDYLYFPTDSYKMICDSIGQSRPVINKALEESDMFRGAKRNKETVKTGITVWDAYGKSKFLSVYAFSRDAFEVFGEPLSLDTEE